MVTETKTKITIGDIFYARFKYDVEDNLWYDENSERCKYGFRIGVSDNENYFELFYGGYNVNLGKHKTKESLNDACFKYNGTKLW